MDFITVDDEEENRWVAETAWSFSYNGWWIGLSGPDKEGDWLWLSDGSSYTSWDVGEPNSSGGEDCTAI